MVAGGFWGEIRENYTHFVVISGAPLDRKHKKADRVSNCRSDSRGGCFDATDVKLAANKRMAVQIEQPTLCR